MKTSELQGAALDWAVAKCEYFPVRDGFDDNCPEYSTDWAQGGPIIDRERICLIDQGGDYWQGLWGWKEAFGPTPMIAAMRCYVAGKMGDEVDVPEELLQGEQNA
jgi:hypothetical protein